MTDAARPQSRGCCLAWCGCTAEYLCHLLSRFRVLGESIAGQAEAMVPPLNCAGSMRVILGKDCLTLAAH